MSERLSLREWRWTHERTHICVLIKHDNGRIVHACECVRMCILASQQLNITNRSNRSNKCYNTVTETNYLHIIYFPTDYFNLSNDNLYYIVIVEINNHGRTETQMQSSTLIFSRLLARAHFSCAYVSVKSIDIWLCFDAFTKWANHRQYLLHPMLSHAHTHRDLSAAGLHCIIVHWAEVGQSWLTTRSHEKTKIVWNQQYAIFLYTMFHCWLRVSIAVCLSVPVCVCLFFCFFFCFFSIFCLNNIEKWNEITINGFYLCQVCANEWNCRFWCHDGCRVWCVVVLYDAMLKFDDINNEISTTHAISADEQSFNKFRWWEIG